MAVGLASVSAVSAGGFGSLAARTDATVATWGYNAYGQLGHATTADAHAPTAAPALAGAGATSAGPVHSLQVLADGSARAWGFGATGALGDGTTDSHPTPVAVDGLAAPGTALAAYAYRGDGLRTSKAVAGQTRPFSWDESGPVPLVLSDGALRFVYGPGGRPLYQLDAHDVPTYLHQDQLGSTRQLTSATGEVVATFTYGPYRELAASTGTATTPLRFAGEYTDAETGFVYLRARYYDPATAQFLTRDPLVALTGEPYLYAGGNPINAIDPLGLAPWDALKSAWDATGGRAVSMVAGIEKQDVANLAGGVLNTITFGQERRITGALGIDGNVDRCSGWYVGGEVVGLAVPGGALGRGWKAGHEVRFGQNLRIAPFGNRTGHELGRWPHYHRRGIDSGTGLTRPGQGIGRHRPWETKPTDPWLWDRF